MRNYILNLVLLLSLTSYAQNNTTEVFILSTLHRNHAENKNYSYEHLDQLVAAFQPTVLAVEIRPEDLHRPADYLSKFYPIEMSKYLHQNNQITYYGFDWFGDDIKDNVLSEDYFNHVNEMRVLQKKLNEDQDAKNKLTLLTPVKNEIVHLAKNASAAEMIDGRYDMASRIYYAQMKQLLEGTPYIGIYNFSLKRDEKIATNIAQIIRKHPNQRILVLMGADHRAYTVNYLENQKDLPFHLVTKI